MKPMTLITVTAAALAMTAATAKVIPNLSHPNPEFTLVLGDGDHSQAASQLHGDLTLTRGFAFATLPNQPVGGGFVTITNNGSQEDRLIGATSPLAGRIEIHTMEITNDVMKMREVDGGLVIPAGQMVEMKPGGYHLMFVALNAGLVAGEQAQVTLQFEQAGDVTMMLPIEPRMRSGHSRNDTSSGAQ